MEPCPDCKHLLPDEEFEIEDTTFHLAISSEHREKLNRLRREKEFENLNAICREIVRTFAADIDTEDTNTIPRAVLSNQDSQKSTVTFVLGEYEAECISELVGAGMYLSAANVVRTAIQHYIEKNQTQTG
jgi:Arc/MetJ-type ribon-helix-helix transcriptional regulator